MNQQSPARDPDLRVLARFMALFLAVKFFAIIVAWGAYMLTYIVVATLGAEAGTGGVFDAISLAVRSVLSPSPYNAKHMIMVIGGTVLAVLLFRAGSGRLRRDENRFFWGKS